MGRHEPEPELPWAEVPPRDVPDRFVPIGRFYKVDIGKEGIGIMALKSRGHPFEGLVTCVHIVGIQHANQIAGGKPQSFIHGVVRAAVGFGQKGADP